MKSAICIALLLLISGSVIAGAKNDKTETAHPVSKRTFVYE